jgi:hypothetical protein
LKIWLKFLKYSTEYLFVNQRKLNFNTSIFETNRPVSHFQICSELFLTFPFSSILLKRFSLFLKEMSIIGYFCYWIVFDQIKKESSLFFLDEFFQAASSTSFFRDRSFREWIKSFESRSVRNCLNLETKILL